MGVVSGRTVFVHSFLGLIFGKQKDVNQLLYDCLRELIGSTGTIVVPTFTFKCCHGLTFDPNNTESEVGAFSNWVMKLKDTKRSLHPIHSVSAIGYKADEITQQVSDSSFGNDSTFSKLIELDALLLMVGVDIDFATLIHQVEEDMQVPYRYYKNFQTKISKDNLAYNVSTPYYAKYLDRDTVYRIDEIKNKLIECNQYQYTRLGWGKICASDFDGFYQVLKSEVSNNPYYCIEKEVYLNSILD